LALGSGLGLRLEIRLGLREVGNYQKQVGGCADLWMSQQDWG